MTNLIAFPGSKKRSRKKVDDLFLEKLGDHETHDSFKDYSFTCATCRHTNNFKFGGVIFKECSFYCAGCGTGYKLDNPIFSSNHKARSR